MGWFSKWFGSGTPDDYRNPFWRLTEYLAVKVEWHRTLIDLRLFFKRNGKWTSHLGFWKPVEQNFWNGIFTFSIYIIKTTVRGFPLIIPRYNVVFRPLRDWYFESGLGYLFDRGEFGFKFVIQNSHSQNDAEGWNEGSV